MENDRIIGGMTTKCSEMAVALYKTFVKGDYVVTNSRTAELAKLAENSFRDVNIAFANELSMICDELDIDVWELIALANRHPRVSILQPGAGVGGHCIAVDPWFIVDSAPDQARLIKMARDVNNHKPDWVEDKVKTTIADVLSAQSDKTMKDVKVACLGLAFKPNIDDLRESPAMEITQRLKSVGCELLIVEPHIESLPNKLQAEQVSLVALEQAVQEADVICVFVKHAVFMQAAGMIKRTKYLIDAVGL